MKINHSWISKYTFPPMGSPKWECNKKSPVIQPGIVHLKNPVIPGQESLKIQTPPDRLGFVVEKSHPQNRIRSGKSLFFRAYRSDP